MILAGDIGGTKCTLTLFSVNGSTLTPVFRFSASTRDANSLESILDLFKAGARKAGHDLRNGTLAASSFGVAGAIVGDRVVSTNLPWAVERASLAQSIDLSLDRVLLLNDLVASASSLVHLKATDLMQLNDGTPQPRAPMALIAAGTGLGEAILFWDGQRYKVSPSEASLTDFAPHNERELLLLQSMRYRMPRVCTEEVVSGRGFRAIHQIIFPGVHHPFFDEPGVDPAAKITQQAFDGSCKACEETLHIWMEAYGAEAGNMALRVLPFGGVYVAGGIALKVLPKLKEGNFVRAFSDKAKLSTQLARIPIFVVLNEDAPVLGAAHEALAVLRETT
jgi:glucokinase